MSGRLFLGVETSALGRPWRDRLDIEAQPVPLAEQHRILLTHMTPTGRNTGAAVFADLIAAKPDGTLWVYRGNGSGGFITGPLQIGSSGWTTMGLISSPGDFDGDGYPDVIVRKTSDGTLWLYKGNGAGGWKPPGVQIGTGWGTLTIF